MNWKMFRVLLCLFPWIGFAVYSYSQTDPNITLFKSHSYWNFQQQMWQLGYHQRPLSALLFIIIVAVLFLTYAIVLQYFSQEEKKAYIILVLVVLLFSYPALSHDIYNYLFNAKMVLQYHMNPHVHVALEFSSDPWLRFMHNTHTPAPYGYGWTIFSLLPAVIGMKKLVLSLLMFRFWMIGGFVALLWLQLKKQWNSVSHLQYFWVFAINPLILIETVGTIHNDVWMMLPAIASLFILGLSIEKKKKRVLFVFLSILLFLFSISIKYASAALLPVFGLLLLSQTKILKRWTQILVPYWADLAAICIFLPLFTDRAQQFHPWYLFWSFSFAPWIKTKMIIYALISFSVSSALRYVPYLYDGGFSQTVLMQQKGTTWVGAIVVFFILLGVSKLRFLLTRRTKKN